MTTWRNVVEGEKGLFSETDFSIGVAQLSGNKPAARHLARLTLSAKYDEVITKTLKRSIGKSAYFPISNASSQTFPLFRFEQKNRGGNVTTSPIFAPTNLITKIQPAKDQPPKDVRMFAAWRLEDNKGVELRLAPIIHLLEFFGITDPSKIQTATMKNLEGYTGKVIMTVKAFTQENPEGEEWTVKVPGGNRNVYVSQTAGDVRETELSSGFRVFIFDKELKDALDNMMMERTIEAAKEPEILDVTSIGWIKGSELSDETEPSSDVGSKPESDVESKSVSVSDDESESVSVSVSDDESESVSVSDDKSESGFVPEDESESESPPKKEPAKEEKKKKKKKKKDEEKQTKDRTPVVEVKEEPAATNKEEKKKTKKKKTKKKRETSGKTRIIEVRDEEEDEAESAPSVQPAPAIEPTVEKKGSEKPARTVTEEEDEDKELRRRLRANKKKRKEARLAEGERLRKEEAERRAARKIFDETIGLGFNMVYNRDEVLGKKNVPLKTLRRFERDRKRLPQISIGPAADPVIIRVSQIYDLYEGMRHYWFEVTYNGAPISRIDVVDQPHAASDGPLVTREQLQAGVTILVEGKRHVLENPDIRKNSLWTYEKGRVTLVVYTPRENRGRLNITHFRLSVPDYRPKSQGVRSEEDD
jgi:hypothetical protein